MLPASAWIMLAFGALVLYGGLGACLWIAIKKRRKRPGPNEEKDGGG